MKFCLIGELLAALAIEDEELHREREREIEAKKYMFANVSQNGMVTKGKPILKSERTCAQRLKMCKMRRHAKKIGSHPPPVNPLSVPQLTLCSGGGKNIKKLSFRNL